MKYKISLYIPAKDCEKTLVDAIESALKQTYPIEELLIIADLRSTDKTVNIAKSYKKIKVIEQKEGGIGLASNLALANAKGDFIACCDADLILERNCLEKLIINFEKDKDIVLAAGKVVEIINSIYDKWREINIPHNWGDYSFYNPYMLVDPCCAKRDILLKIGGYNNSYLYCYEDSDLCFRLKDAGYKIYYEKDAIAYHQRNDDLYSLLNTFWRFKTFKGKSINTLSEILNKADLNIMLGITTLNKVLAKKEYELVYISFLLPFHHILKDLEYYFISRVFVDDKGLFYHLNLLFSLIANILNNYSKKLKDKVLNDLTGFFKNIKQGKNYKIEKVQPLPKFNYFLEIINQKLNNYINLLPKSIIEEPAIIATSKHQPVNIHHQPDISLYDEYLLSVLKSKKIFCYNKMPYSIKQKLKNIEIIEGVDTNSKFEQVVNFYLGNDMIPFKTLDKLKKITTKDLLLLVSYPQKVIIGYEPLYPKDLAEWAAKEGFRIINFQITPYQFFLHISRGTS